VKGKIIAALRRSKAMDQAYSEARKARNTIYQEENFEEYARKHNLNIYSGEIVAKEPPKESWPPSKGWINTSHPLNLTKSHRSFLHRRVTRSSNWYPGRLPGPRNSQK